MMFNNRRVLTLAGLGATLFLGGCAGELGDAASAGARGAGEGLPQAGPTRARALPIVGGELERDHPAVGALTWFGEAFCTGTLVRPDVVVTAAHCLAEADDTEGFGFFVGADARRPSTGTTIPVQSVHIHPSYGKEGDNDIGVLVLSRSAPVEPVDLLTRPMGQEWVGRRPLFVGYGVSSATSESTGIKRSVEIPIEELDDTRFLYASPRANTCFGDSGGPALFELRGRWTLIGVTSWGDEDCREFGVNARVDPYLDFIERFTDGPLAPPNDATPDAPPPPPPSDEDDEFEDEDEEFGDDDVGRDCDPEYWDSACDEELDEIVDGFVDILDEAGEGNGGGGCSVSGASGRGADRGLGALLLMGLVAGAARRRRR